MAADKAGHQEQQRPGAHSPLGTIPQHPRLPLVAKAALSRSRPTSSRTNLAPFVTAVSTFLAPSVRFGRTAFLLSAARASGRRRRARHLKRASGAAVVWAPCQIERSLQGRRRCVRLTPPYAANHTHFQSLRIACAFFGCWTSNRVAARSSLAAARASFGALRVGARRSRDEPNLGESTPCFCFPRGLRKTGDFVCNAQPPAAPIRR